MPLPIHLDDHGDDGLIAVTGNGTGTDTIVTSGIDNIILVTGRGKNAIEDHFDVSYELEKLLEEREALRLVLSTGSPLAEHSYDYVHRDVRPGVHLASISGGTAHPLSAGDTTLTAIYEAGAGSCTSTTTFSGSPVSADTASCRYRPATGSAACCRGRGRRRAVPHRRPCSRGRRC